MVDIITFCNQCQPLSFFPFGVRATYKYDEHPRPVVWVGYTMRIITGSNPLFNWIKRRIPRQSGTDHHIIVLDTTHHRRELCTTLLQKCCTEYFTPHKCMICRRQTSDRPLHPYRPIPATYRPLKYGCFLGAYSWGLQLTSIILHIYYIIIL